MAKKSHGNEIAFQGWKVKRPHKEPSKKTAFFEPELLKATGFKQHEGRECATAAGIMGYFRLIPSYAR